MSQLSKIEQVWLTARAAAVQSNAFYNGGGGYPYANEVAKSAVKQFKAAFPEEEVKEVLEPPVLLRYQCATCGNTCLEEKRPDNSKCGGCDTPDWKLMIQQEAYKIGQVDWIHPDGEI